MPPVSWSYKYRAADFHFHAFILLQLSSGCVLINIYERVLSFWCPSLQGRNPFFLEPAIIIAISDGNKLTSGGGVQDEVSHIFFSPPCFSPKCSLETFETCKTFLLLISVLHICLILSTLKLHFKPSSVQAFNLSLFLSFFLLFKIHYDS